MAKSRRPVESVEDVSDGEDRELSEEQLARRQEKREREQALASPFAAESDQNLKTDAEANGGATEGEPELAVVDHGKDEGEPGSARPVRVNRRAERLRAAEERGPLARYEFRLMIGAHSGQDYEQPILTDTTTGEPRKDRRRPSRLYEAADTVWSNTDLAKSQNRPNSIKFRLIKDWGPGAYTDGVDPEAGKPGKRAGARPGENVEEDRVEIPKKAELMEMSVGDMREYAAREEINLHGATTKEEIADAIVKELRTRLRSGNL